MKRPFIHLCLGVLLLVAAPFSLSAADALEPFSMQLRWITQTQFAGYYAALDKGFYRNRGLDVVILPGGPNLDSVQNLKRGVVDVGIEWLPHALLQRASGNQIVNIAQIFNRSGYILSCRKDHGINSVKDLDGKRIGSWFVGDEERIQALLRKEGVKASIYSQNFNLSDLIRGEADCISTMRYNEYLQLLDQGGKAEELTTFDFDAHGVSTLEDGLYVREDMLADPQFRDRLIRFVAATIEGWRYTREHPNEVMEIVLDHDPTGALDPDHQQAMLRVVLQLLHPLDEKIGELSAEAYRQTVDQLLESGLLEHNPQETGYSHEIWIAARQLLQP